MTETTLGDGTGTTPRRWLTALLVFVLPVVMLVGSLTLAISWRSDLPDPIATHWGDGGRADGFGSMASMLVFPSILSFIVFSTCTAITLWAGNQVAAKRRMSVGISVGVTGLMCGIILSSLAVQRGLADAHEVGPMNLLDALAPVLVAVVIGVPAMLLVPGDPEPADGRGADGRTAATAPRITLGETENAVWVRREWRSPVAFAIGGGAVALSVLAALVAHDGWLLLTSAGLVVFLVMATAWVVTIDRTGLRVRSVLGVPRFIVPLDRIDRAEAVDVSPPEYGGWGLRVLTGRDTAIILRRGPALSVSYSRDRRITVTVADAATGAALLNALVARER